MKVTSRSFPLPWRLQKPAANGMRIVMQSNWNITTPNAGSGGGCRRPPGRVLGIVCPSDCLSDWDKRKTPITNSCSATTCDGRQSGERRGQDSCPIASFVVPSAGGKSRPGTETKETKTLTNNEAIVIWWIASNCQSHQRAPTVHRSCTNTHFVEPVTPMPSSITLVLYPPSGKRASQLNVVYAIPSSFARSVIVASNGFTDSK